MLLDTLRLADLATDPTFKNDLRNDVNSFKVCYQSKNERSALQVTLVWLSYSLSADAGHTRHCGCFSGGYKDLRYCEVEQTPGFLQSVQMMSFVFFSLPASSKISHVFIFIFSISTDVLIR